MKRPSFQFYPGDWRANSNLRRCSWSARGVWLEVMCLMHDSERYGVLAWSLKEIAQALGCGAAPLNELVTKGVLKGCDGGECDPYIYTPRSGRKDGDPVELVPAQAGPIWYSSRMVRDNYVRENAGSGSRFHSPSPSPSRRHGEDQSEDQGEAPSRRHSEDQSDGSSSSSSSSINTPPIPPTPPDGDAVGAGPKKRTRSPAVAIGTWLDAVKAKGELPIPADDPVFDYAEKAGIPVEYVFLAWREFQAKNTGGAKRYSDWRQAFRNCVRGSWYGLWYAKPDGDYTLTTKGIQAQRVFDAAPKLEAVA